MEKAKLIMLVDDDSNTILKVYSPGTFNKVEFGKYLDTLKSTRNVKASLYTIPVEKITKGTK